MKPLAAAVLLTAALLPTAALADPDCTAEPKDRWISEDAMKAKAAELGYVKIKTFKVSGSCYEIYGWNKEDKRVEVYFNPVTGAVVESEID